MTVSKFEGYTLKAVRTADGDVFGYIDGVRVYAHTGLTEKEMIAKLMEFVG